MRSRELALEKYNTDKLPIATSNGTTLCRNISCQKKSNSWNSASWKAVPICSGVTIFLRGGSWALTSKLKPICLVKNGSESFRARNKTGSQQDTGFLSEVVRETAPEGLDIIIDDASHFGNLTKISFWHLFDNHLKPSGLYVIDDWGTGYWSDWPDGKTYRLRSEPYSGFLSLLRKLGVISRIPSHSHHYGMVGFIKELVDEQGAADLARARLTGTVTRGSKFENMTITPCIVLIKKRSA